MRRFTAGGSNRAIGVCTRTREEEKQQQKKKNPEQTRFQEFLAQHRRDDRFPDVSLGIRVHVHEDASLLYEPGASWVFLSCLLESPVSGLLGALSGGLMGHRSVDVSQSRSQAETSTQVFLKSSIRNFRGADATSPLSYKAVMLEYSRPKKEKVKRRSKGSRMNAAQKRRMKLFTIRPEHQRYELFLPLHHLWRQYITDVCGGLKPTSSPQFLQQKLLKADLHGAVLSGLYL
ncbi:Ribonuclease P protein subunit p29 [Takifugu flavidus]|uniref:Ribonuclease P protein subunit p29 n=1 Tax=Takifugu flavidus TaxID=433684 RepID=A0A5C6NK29_9TELE|nr:Ribonuclease P protein subunit p29 [Takifugu flavidus]